jgi:hypothetical protein
MTGEFGRAGAAGGEPLKAQLAMWEKALGV